MRSGLYSKDKKRHLSVKGQGVSKEDMSSGSITVEAAFVMPIVILIIFALIYLAFYLHDINKVQGVADLTLHKAALTVKHEADIATGEVTYEDINDRGIFYMLLGNTEKEEEEITELCEQELSQGLFLVKIRSIKVEAGNFNISIAVETAAEITLPGLSHLFYVFPDKTITGEHVVHNPAETVRCTEVILETASDIKGVDELKKKIENMIGSK
jgi:hypothetical protein